MVLSKKRITKALIRLCGCAGWSAPVLLKKEDRFSRVEALLLVDHKFLIAYLICCGFIFS